MQLILFCIVLSGIGWLFYSMNRLFSGRGKMQFESLRRYRFVFRLSVTDLRRTRWQILKAKEVLKNGWKYGYLVPRSWLLRHLRNGVYWESRFLELSSRFFPSFRFRLIPSWKTHLNLMTVSFFLCFLGLGSEDHRMASILPAQEGGQSETSVLPNLLPARHVAVVCPLAFQETLRPWIKYRESQGYIIHLLTEPEPERLPDGRLDWGVLEQLPVDEPSRIRKKIIELSEKVPLYAILLVGDGAPLPQSRYQWRDIVPAARVPAKVVQKFDPEYHIDHIASDSWYADLNEDGLPEVAIGRFSVHNTRQLENIIQKTIRYETQTPKGLWQRKVNFIVGIGGFSPVVDHVIESAVRSMLADLLPDAFEVSLTYANWRSPYCPWPDNFSETVLERINEGSLFAAYVGHGYHRGLDCLETPDLPSLSSKKRVELSGTPSRDSDSSMVPLNHNQSEQDDSLRNNRGEVGDNDGDNEELDSSSFSGENSDKWRVRDGNRYYKIFELDDLEYLDCFRSGAPILLFFACYTGAFDANEDSLAEQVHRAQKGPVAVLAASRTSMPYGMATLGASLLNEAFEKRTATLGEMLLNAKRDLMLARFDPNTQMNQSDSPLQDEVDFPSDGASEVADLTQTRTHFSSGAPSDEGSEDAPGPSNEKMGPSESEKESPQRTNEISKRLNKIREKKSIEEIRISLSQLAKLFDPSARFLPEQREDHLHLFNLFGDPLLQLALPKTVSIEVPELVYSDQSLIISGEVPQEEIVSDGGDHALGTVSGEENGSGAEWSVRVELAVNRSNSPIPRKTRQEFDISESEKSEWEATYQAINTTVLSTAETVTEQGRFSTQLPIPKGRTGAMTVRVLLLNNNECRMNAMPITIRPRSPEDVTGLGGK